ncbi:TIGR02172 family protein [Ruminococcaceae bacterium YRB3002]|nr:TIGR02172 family protein [Ruminococcaceae bacterium YRB3002]
MSDSVKIVLEGRIDSNNASEFEARINGELEGTGKAPVVLDMSDLAYISSAGLRILLRIKKSHPDMSLINVSSEVYEIMEMTGFTELMNVSKAYRVVSTEGCEIIGKGANGTVYRIDHDNVLKVYNNADALEDIQHEREVAKLALILGIPTAISYDVVKVGDSYGSVFELLDARSFANILSTEPEKLDWCVKEFVTLLKKIHRTKVPEGKLPDIKDTADFWVNQLKGHLPADKHEKLRKLISGVPHCDTMIHGDYHTKNVMATGDEVLLIDMDTLSVGNPIFELGFIYNACIGFSEYDNEQIKRFQGFDLNLSKQFWHKSLAMYLGTDNEEKLRKVEDKARIVGYTRLIRRTFDKDGNYDPKNKPEIDLWTSELIDLLDKYDTLTFTPNEIVVDAVLENLTEVQAFIDEHLESAECSMKIQMQIALAVEEIFVNIAHYAYAPKVGLATVRVEVSENPLSVTITFLDNGIPYDPLAKEDPDVTLPAEQRNIGGLGIFITKKTMDDVTYEYKDGQNILRLKKNL